MSSIKTRLNNARAKFLRRSSGTSTATRSIASSAGSVVDKPAKTPGSNTVRKSISLSKLPEASNSDIHGGEAEDGGGGRLVQSEILGTAAATKRAEPSPGGSLTSDQHSPTSASTHHNIPTTTAATTTTAHDSNPAAAVSVPTACPTVTLEAPTPIHPDVHPAALVPEPSPSSATTSSPAPTHPSSDIERPSAQSSLPSSSKPTPPEILRRQSVLTTTDAKVITTLLAPEDTVQAASAPLPATDYFGSAAPAAFSAAMLHRKIWVKRPNASATLVQIREDDLVDDVRDMILKKYTNSLGRSYDAPDVTLRIVPRDAARGQDRVLGPEEEMCRTLDAYYPGGQTVNEALIIEVPQPQRRTTPRPSPRVPTYHPYHDDASHSQTEYFPPMPVTQPSPSAASVGHHERIPLPHAPHSIAVLSTGQLPPLPSPGGTRRLHQAGRRPQFVRHTTASPTILGGGVPSSATSTRPPGRPRHDSSASEAKNSSTSNNPIPTPPAATDPAIRNSSNPPTPRVASPPPVKDKKRRKKPAPEQPTLPAGLLDGSVPPINVLIVEDNIINLRVLGAFMQRLKVRWQRAMNGKEAVTKWKAGGFHLVLMDIQLPVMNGLEATKEIRRLERVNSIGVFSSGSREAPNNRLGYTDANGKAKDDIDEDDRLGVDQGLFKSPVIIVALTASSLQSDRHEALAAGCNDFLTKPVNFVWLERKVKEWGCMQALIDFDGWRKWKDFADKSETMDSKSKMTSSFHSIAPKKKDRAPSPTVAANPSDGAGMSANGTTPKKEEEEKKKSKRKSGVIPPPVVQEENENEHGTPEQETSSS